MRIPLPRPWETDRCPDEERRSEADSLWTNSLIWRLCLGSQWETQISSYPGPCVGDRGVLMAVLNEWCPTFRGLLTICSISVEGTSIELLNYWSEDGEECSYNQAWSVWLSSCWVRASQRQKFSTEKSMFNSIVLRKQAQSETWEAVHLTSRMVETFLWQ